MWNLSAWEDESQPTEQEVETPFWEMDLMDRDDVILLAGAIGQGCERIAEALETLAYKISEDATLGDDIYHGLIAAAKRIKEPEA